MTRVDRRAFLVTGGITAATALAGCLDDAAVATYPADRGEVAPVPGTAAVVGIDRVDDEELVVELADRRFPRPATIRLSALYPTDSTPAGDWRVERVPGDAVARPVLTYPGGHGERVSDTVVGPQFGDGSVSLAHGDVPAGIPVQYRLDLVEHTLDGQRSALGTTEQVLRLPGRGRYAVAATDGGGGHRVLRDYSHADYYHRRRDGDGDYRLTAVGSTNGTRFHAPLVDGLPDRTDGVGHRAYRRGAFERLWTLDYVVTRAEFRRARDHNRRHYRGDPAAEAVEVANVRRMFRHYLGGGGNDPEGNGDGGDPGGNGGDPGGKGADATPGDAADVEGVESHGRDLARGPLERIAATLAGRAALLGFTRPEQQVRLVADFVQWLPYEHDDERVAAGIPRVQHPVCTLARGTGDCEDATVALAAILSREPFPDFELSVYRFRNEDDPGNRAHFGLAIREGLWSTDLGGPGSAEFGHTYVEATYPAPLASASPECHDLELLAGVRSPNHGG